MTPKQNVIDYYNRNGFYIVTSPGQQEAVDEVVKEGLLRKADPSWFYGNPDNLYVHSSVSSKQHIPLALYKRVLYSDFYVGEIVEIYIPAEPYSISVYAKILQKYPNGKYEVAVLQSEHDLMIVDSSVMRRTFVMQ